MDKIRRFFCNLSFRASFILYVAVCAFIALALILTTSFLCQRTIKDIQTVYSNDKQPYYLLTPEGEKIELSGEAASIWKDDMILTDEDSAKISALKAVTYLCIPFYSVLCLVVATMLFYRNKMKIPLAILREAHQRISDNDLDFTIHYATKDEMGQLVESFEKMRAALLENNQRMWRQMEQRKQLNAAFAHDLRTPLTVLKGYSEILQNDSENQDTKDTAATMEKHIGRLERYVEGMSTLQNMEDVAPDYKNINLTDFLKSAEQMSALICKSAGKRLSFKGNIEIITAAFDRDMIFEVIENLISNAARYAKNEVCVDVSKENSIITVTVQDDGTGFSSENLHRATEPYYTGDEDRGSHFGLGLYICKVLCEHHGGRIKIENTAPGARIIASFAIRESQ